MAAIGKIRKQSGLLIILIGVAMVLFLLGDLFSGGANIFTQQEQIVGTIAGDEISMQEYEIRVQEALDAQFGVEGASETQKKTVRERVWQQMIRERVFDTELANLGLTVSADEIMDNVRNAQPGSVLYQYFTDPQTNQVIEQFRDPQTGGLNSDRVVQAIQNLLNSENARDWLPIEQAIQQDVATRKYSTMLSKGMMISSIEANQIAAEKNAQVNFSYVVKEFMPLNGEEFEPTDDELKAFFNEHRDEDRFKVEDESRSIKMALFEVMPTPEDIQAISDELAELIPEFKADSNDTAYVMENAEGQLRNLIRYQGAEDLNPAIKDSIINAEIGAVFGPINEGSRFLIHKFLGTKSSPDSVRASHILISVNDGDTAKISAAKAKLDSLKSVAQKKRNFAELAEQFSEDFGSAKNGGDLDWFTRGRMVAPFEKACFDGKTGGMPIVETQFGVHLIYITDQTEYKPEYLIASVDRNIEPSKETSDEIYREASTFSIDHKTLESFDDPGGVRVEEMDGLRMVDEVVGPIPNAREIIRWVFDAEVGDVSSPFEVDGFFILAAVSHVSETGIMDFETAKNLIYAEVNNKKKSDKIIADLGDYTTLPQAANALGVDVMTANNVSFAQGSLPGGLGREMVVLGNAFGLEQGVVSQPIVGNRGVYVIEVQERSKPEAASDLATVKRTESTNMESRVNNQVYNALQEGADIKDERGKYY